MRQRDRGIERNGKAEICTTSMPWQREVWMMKKTHANKMNESERAKSQWIR